MQRLAVKLAAMIFGLGAASGLAQDMLEVVSTDPPSPAVLEIGDWLLWKGGRVHVTIRYRAVSTKHPRIY